MGFHSGISAAGGSSEDYVHFRNLMDVCASTTAAKHLDEDIMRFLWDCPGFDAEKSEVVFSLICGNATGGIELIRFVMSRDFDINRTVIVERNAWKEPEGAEGSKILSRNLE